MLQKKTIGLIPGAMFLLFFSLTGCNGQATHMSTKDGIEIELDSLIPILLKQNDIPGVSVAVIRNTEVVLAKGYGLADKSNNTAVTINTRFQIGSVSKTITALAVLKLVEEGKVGLDDSIEKCLKSWHIPKSEFDKNLVTVRMVLSHTSGFSVAGYHGLSKPGDKLPTLQESLNGYSGSDGALQIINKPGSTFRYSSGGYTLLQLLIQDITGLPFTEYVQQKIFTPLGLKNSTYEWSSELEKAVATPYNKAGKPWAHYQFAESASGGLYTTASDLAKLISVLFQNNKRHDIIKAETTAQMIIPANGTGGNYGLGCKIFPINETQKVIMHDGANEGWRAAYYIYPPSGDGVVMLINSDKGGKVGAPIICSVFKRTAVDFSKLCATLKK